MYIHNYTGYQTSINTSHLVQGYVHISSSMKCISKTAITANKTPVTKQTHLQQLADTGFCYTCAPWPGCGAASSHQFHSCQNLQSHAFVADASFQHVH